MVRSSEADKTTFLHIDKCTPRAKALLKIKTLLSHKFSVWNDGLKFLSILYLGKNTLGSGQEGSSHRLVNS